MPCICRGLEHSPYHQSDCPARHDDIGGSWHDLAADIVYLRAELRRMLAEQGAEPQRYGFCLCLSCCSFKDGQRVRSG